MYRNWPQWIGDTDGVEVCPVQLPGRENRMREPSYTRYEALAAGFSEALAPYLDRPFGLFGHCGSALSAFAVAALLDRGDHPATHLFVSSQVAPHEGPYGRFLSMSDAELTDELLLLMKQMGAEPHPSLVEMMLDVLRIDVAANRAYRMPAPFQIGCAVTAIGWSRDTEIPVALMSGWAQYGDDATVVVLNGEHDSFRDAPSELTDLFQRTLLTADSRTTRKG